MTLGKLSGRNALRARLQDLGIAIQTETTQCGVRAVQGLGRQEAIFDEDLQALMSDEVVTPARREHYKLVALRVCSETGEVPVAGVTLTVDGREPGGSSWFWTRRWRVQGD